MKSFPAKLLLFGEYAVVRSGQGFAIPYSDYNCALSSKSDMANRVTASKEILMKMACHIEKNPSLSRSFFMDRFKKDIRNGLSIYMNIPIGYGLGSSGALTAAVFDRYSTERPTSVPVLKEILGNIESVFHGKSSGLDPLISYLQKSVWLHAPNGDQVVDTYSTPKNKSLFLLNSGKSRKTSPLVAHFVQQIDTDSCFRNIVDHRIMPLNNQLIEQILTEKNDSFHHCFKKLSLLQYEHFDRMITSNIQPIWKQGIDTDSFYLKLCGAGGGGFYLGFMQNKEQAAEILNQHDLNYTILGT